ncbi:MAG: DUF87 domain-containing protein, partial [Candidatus Aenigmarchaeota archaeon]|nr:DUF87 domain-containing protein [Candidatus Aenigmarchaeota archaeon]
RFDYFPNKTADDIGNIELPDTANKNILLAMVVDTNLTNTADFIIDYTDALNSHNPTENILEIFICENWNYSSRTCNGGKFTYLVGTDNLNSSNPNVALNLFNFSTDHLSAFAIAESSYPNTWGTSQQNPPNQNSPGGSSGSSSSLDDDDEETVCGNGVCEVGENWQNCLRDCPKEEFPLIIDTNIGDVRIFPGESKAYWISLKNKLTSEVEATLEATNDLGELLSLNPSRKIILPNATDQFDIDVIVPYNYTFGIYTGKIVIKAEGQKQSIPVTIRILESAAAFYSVEIDITSKTIKPEGNIDFVVKLTNLGERKEYPMNLTYIIKDQKTNKVIQEVKTNTTLETTTIVRESFRLNITEEGSYTLEVWADYKNKSIMDVATFSVIKPIFESPLTLGLLLLALAMAVAVGGTYIWKYYRVWKREREKEQRYLYPLDYTKVPREGFKIGKFAGTDNYCYYDPKDLTTHMIAAGATGAGKSVSASVFVEEALDKKIPVIVFDPTAQWTGFVRACRDDNLIKKYTKFDMSDFDIKSYPGLINEVEDPNFKLDIKEYINPGEITVFCLNKLGAGEYDEAVHNIINSVFGESWEESPDLKLILVFDEVHRLLEKYGGKGGYVALEKAAREFRKWGIGIIMCSQVLADFKEAIAGNVLTEIQFNTKSLTDIDKVKTKYGNRYSERIARMGVGAGLMQYPKYNDGKPFFVEFRPSKHNPHKITDDELELYKKYTARLKIIGAKINRLKKQKKVYTEDYEIDMKLALAKLKTGNFRMVEIYVSSLEKS